MAFITLLKVVSIIIMARQVVIVEQLFPCSDVSQRFNIDTSSIGDGFAVRLAGVVDELGLIASDPRVNHGPAIYAK